MQERSETYQQKDAGVSSRYAIAAIIMALAIAGTLIGTDAWLARSPETHPVVGIVMMFGIVIGGLYAFVWALTSRFDR